MLAVSNPVSVFAAPEDPEDGKTHLLKSLVEAAESQTAELFLLQHFDFIFEQ